jgi:hypothetical protein
MDVHSRYQPNTSLTLHENPGSTSSPESVSESLRFEMSPRGDERGRWTRTVLVGG